MNIELRALEKRFGDFVATDRVDLTIESGELIALLGPSGCGKTTLLRLIAGLEFPDGGAILFDGQDTAPLPVRDRKVGFVFQHYALFKHMKVADNVAFGLNVLPRKARPTKATIAARVAELLDLVQLSSMADRYPNQLSGGQRQRVALARALAINPRVLLLDEPFGALDARVRKDLRRWMRELHRKTGYTTVFVTHDQEEALELADRVVVMNAGRIEQVGSTVAVYERPANPFVFEFLGDSNVLPLEHLPCAAEPRVGKTRAAEPRVGKTRAAEPRVGKTSAEKEGTAQDGRLYIRPHDFALVTDGTPGIDATVVSAQRTGPIVRITARCVKGGDLLELEFSHLDTRAIALAVGDPLRVVPQRYEVFPV